MTNHQLSNVVEYLTRSHINIYDSPKCDRLATQAATGRHLRVVNPPQPPLVKGGRDGIDSLVKGGRDGIDSLVKGGRDGIDSLVKGGRDGIDSLVKGGRDGIDSLVKGGRDGIDSLVKGGRDGIDSLATGERDGIDSLATGGRDGIDSLATGGRDGIDSLVQGGTTAVMVRLCEDDYPGWLDIRDVELLDVADTFYHPEIFSEAEIKEKFPTVINFAHEAMKQSNYYLWGGTVAPNYDCSGLMQAAFLSVGIWLPRDAYQQEAFTKPISITALKPGDLLFFGTLKKASHVGLYLGDNCYIHSSGKEQGRNGIGIDVLSEDGDKVSQAYYRQLRGYGKVVANYQSGNC